MASQCTDSSEAAYHSKGGKPGSIRGWNFRPTPVRHQEKKRCVCVWWWGVGGWNTNGNNKKQRIGLYWNGTYYLTVEGRDELTLCPLYTFSIASLAALAFRIESPEALDSTS